MHSARSCPAAKPRLLYLMHVDWRWIKQRPQFLAEHLSADYEVQVLHRFLPFGGKRPSRSDLPVHLAPLLPVPWSWKPVRQVTKALQRAWIAAAAYRFQPDVIWLTHPSLFDALPRSLRRLPTVYDCMDDALEFRASAGRLTLLAHLERELVTHSAMTICSSDCLRRRLIARYGPAAEGKIFLVRNAIAPSLLEKDRGAYGRQSLKTPFRVSYFGTIAEWFDFDLLLAVLERHPNLEFHLAGPVITSARPRHSRLKFHGPLAHDDLALFASQADALMMPFHVTPLTEAVDPVKLYEYLAFGAEILCVRYAEVDRFEPFVHFYTGREEFLRLISQLERGVLNRKNLRERTSAFLQENTWNSRARDIATLVRSCGAPALI